MRRLRFYLAGAFALSIECPATAHADVGKAALAALQGQLQVQADKTSWDAKTNQIVLQGNVVITGTGKSGRLTTYRGDRATVKAEQAEFQVTDNVSSEFADGTATVNRALSDGHIAGYAENQLLSALKEHPGFGSYRLHYSGVGAGASTDGNLLFERDKQLFTIYEVFVYPEINVRDLDSRTYVGVSEEALTNAIVQSRKKNLAKRLSNITQYGGQLTNKVKN